jgi:hypothetical protein
MGDGRGLIEVSCMRQPVPPCDAGSADFCLLVDTPAEEVQARLHACGVCREALTRKSCAR